MNWILFSLISGFFFTSSDLITRHILKGDKDSWAFSFWFSFFGALTSLPFFLINPVVPKNGIIILVLVLSCILIVLQNLLVFKSTNLLSPSIQGAVLKFRLVFVLIFGIMFLSEALNAPKLLGTTFTILSGLVLLNSIQGKAYRKGLILAFSSTLFYAAIITFYSILLDVINSVSLTFYIFLIPTILNLLLMPNSINRVKTIIQSSPKSIITSTILAGFANLALNQALSLGEQSKVIIITEVFLIVTLAAEHLLLKEKGNLVKKLIAVLLAIFGAIFIRLS